MADDIVESDEEELEQRKENKKKVFYSHQTRDLSTKPKKQKINQDGDDSESENEESLEKEEEELEEEEEEEEEEEDDFARQLRLEREEQLRKESGKKENNNKEEVKKTKIDEDGTEYEWDPQIRGWFPKINDHKLIEYQQNYGVVTNPATAKLKENTFYLYNGAFYKFDFASNNWIPADKAVYAYIDYMTGIEYDWNIEKNSWQPKLGSITTTTIASQKTDNTKPLDKNKKKEGWIEISDDKNTNVYVSGLPLDITDEEFEEMMSKYGIIMKDPLTHKLKIKLYRENGEVKGDGRCCYLMPESVKLCLQLLDGTDYKGHKVKVEKAKFEMKGAYDATKHVNKEIAQKKLSKVKEKKLLEKQRQKLLDWEERPEIVRQKHEKVVVIKNIFAPSDFNKDPNYGKKLIEDLKSELETYGSIKKILIHEHNPEGVITVSFKDVEMADTCCDYLDNRVWKNGRIISCKIWDGETKYDVEESEEERKKRIDEWHKYLESDD